YRPLRPGIRRGTTPGAWADVSLYFGQRTLRGKSCFHKCAGGRFLSRTRSAPGALRSRIAGRRSRGASRHRPTRIQKTQSRASRRAAGEPANAAGRNRSSAADRGGNCVFEQLSGRVFTRGCEENRLEASAERAEKDQSKREVPGYGYGGVHL